jgi:hypothetical protein
MVLAAKAMPDFDSMIESLVRELLPLARSSTEPWENAAVQTAIPAAIRRTGPPEELLSWAADHRRWRFAVAEASEEVCAKPTEAAVVVVKTNHEERFDELADQF